ncbi:MAG: hypothetical protein HKN51_03430 [Saprospiraceae bacterium]|nr:hypothetical protein [Saprospiraceae bacterium]
MAFYSVLGFLRPAIFIFLLPIYLSDLAVDEYGMYGLMMDFALLSTIFVSLKLNTSMLTNYYDFLGDQLKIKTFLSSTYTFSFLLGLSSIIILYIIGPWLFGNLYSSESLLFFPFGFIVVLFTAITEMNMTYIVYLKNRKDIIKYTVVLLTQVFSVVILQVIFIVFLERGLQGALEGILFGNILVTLVILLLEKGILNFNIDWKMIKSSLKFSVPLIPYLVIYWFLTRSGKTFLEHYASVETVSIFTLLITIAGLVIFGVEAVVNAIRPFLFEQFAKGENRDNDQVSLLTRLIINGPLLIVPCIILVGTNIHLIPGDPIYRIVDQYISFATFVLFVFVWARLFYQQLVFAKRSNWVTYMSFVVFIILILAFLYFIPRYQIWGVLFATVIANSIMAILFYIIAQKFLRVSYNWIDIIGIPALMFAILFSLEYLFKSNGWSLSVFGFVQFGILIFLILALNWKNIKIYKRLFGLNKT